MRKLHEQEMSCVSGGHPIIVIIGMLQVAEWAWDVKRGIDDGFAATQK